MSQEFSLRPGEKGEWITALEAVHLLSPMIGGDKKAKKALVERLLDSAILTTAWWIATGYDVGPPYVAKLGELPDDHASLSTAQLHDLRVEQSKPTVSETLAGPNHALSLSAGNVIIGGQFWTLATKQDREQWDWSNGLFKYSYPAAYTTEGATKLVDRHSLTARMRTYALGVHFHRPHVLDIVAERNGEPAKASSPPSNAGRKPSYLWANWVAEVISLQDDEAIENFTANQLKERIEKIASEKGVPIPVSSTVYPAARRVLRLLQEKQANRH
jgi:hypothetical protein